MKIKKSSQASAPSTKTPAQPTAKAKNTAKTDAAQAVKTVVAESKGRTKGKATTSEAPAQPRTGINIGVKSGMRVMAYQDHSFAINDQPDRRLTDDELAADWRREFPQSRAVLAGRITADMVRAVRRLYNLGTGGHGTPGTEHNSHPYVIEDGKRVKSVYTRVRKEKAEPVAPPAPAQPAATKKTVAKGAKHGAKKAA